MKKIILSLIFIGMVFTLSSCLEKDFTKLEHYEYVVYLQSKNNENVYDQVCKLDQEEVTGYLSIGCGGSLANPEGFEVELEPDTILFDKFNRKSFDIDSSKYARILSPERYSFSSLKVQFPANNREQYVKVPILIRPQGLSPDSIYLIPIAIKNVSKYRVNKEKKNVLFRVMIENYYAKQISTTFYQLRGMYIDEDGNNRGTFSTTKPAFPIDVNTIRIFAGDAVQTKKSELQEVNKHSILITINQDNSVKIKPYDNIEIIQKEEEGWNRYEEVTPKPWDKRSILKTFYLYYSFRKVKEIGADGVPVYGDWQTVKEKLQKVIDESEDL